MEHGLIILIEVVLALDRKLQKSLASVVPELPRLRTSAREVLAGETLVIGPRRPYAVAIVLGFLVGILVLFIFVMMALERPRNRPIDREYVWSVGLAVVVSTIASALLFLRWLRGGSAVLQEQGVEFVYRGQSVFCPWALFQAAGVPYQPDHKRVILPVNDDVPIAIRDGTDNVSAKLAREIKSKPLTACADGQVALNDLYEVRLGEFGQLLMQLGSQLGDGEVQPHGAVWTDLAPLATAETDGWLRIRLTRLPFPPVCCRCGELTREGVSMLLDARNKASIEVPLCRVCQVERSRRRRAALAWGIGIGIGVPFAWVLFGTAINADVCLGLAMAQAAGMVVGLIVGFILRDRAEPVRFREYSAANGTVAMWIKPAPGIPKFRAALGIVEPVEVDDDDQ